VTEFGQSSNLADAYALHGIDSCAILDAAMSVLGR
jgi:pyruvate dehydrogenase E1 component